MSLLAIYITMGLILLIIIIGAFFSVCLSRLSQKCNELMTKSESAELLCSELLLANHEFKNELTVIKESTNAQSFETKQVSKQLEHHIKSLQQQLTNQELKLTNQEQQIEHWQESQGQDKLYSRAFKLAEKGADIDEIMIECELPRAEAEMLLSVYRQRNNT